MISEALGYLQDWTSHDWKIAVTAAFAAMACAIPGCFLVVRKQSLMGDAISHSALPGIILALLFANWLRGMGIIDEATHIAWRHFVLFAGAILIGVFCAVATEFVQKLGRVDGSAALGVVFTSLFARGILLVRTIADSIDLDPECVLYGTLESASLMTGPWGVPRAAFVNGGVLLFNIALFALLFKEFRISAFDPGLSTSMGINAQWMHYLLMVVTAITLVATFETVGSILVIAMLIVPAATAHLLTDRLGRMLLVSMIVAGASALLGHALALTMPPLVFRRLGYARVEDSSTAGMMAAAAGLLFFLAVLASPRYGVLTRGVRQTALAWRVAAEDVLGFLFRLEERSADAPVPAQSAALRGKLAMNGLQVRLALFFLRSRRFIARSGAGWRLTAAGRQHAQHLVRSHRLWESFIARHYPTDEHLHESAARVEHFIDERLRAQLADELNSPAVDPHGATIPAEGSPAENR